MQAVRKLCSEGELGQRLVQDLQKLATDVDQKPELISNWGDWSWGKPLQFERGEPSNRCTQGGRKRYLLHTLVVGHGSSRSELTQEKYRTKQGLQISQRKGSRLQDNTFTCDFNPVQRRASTFKLQDSAFSTFSRSDLFQTSVGQQQAGARTMDLLVGNNVGNTPAGMLNLSVLMFWEMKVVNWKSWVHSCFPWNIPQNSEQVLPIWCLK